MRFDLWISRRLSLGRGTPASTVTGVVIAVAGVALALIVMELSMAVCTGFKQEIRRKLSGFDAAVSVMSAGGDMSAVPEPSLHVSDTLLAVVREAVPEGRLSATVRRQAILKTGEDFAAVECVAHGIGHDYGFERSNITEGYLPDYGRGDGTDSIVISGNTAARMGLATGDKTYLYFFADGAVKARRVYIAGQYCSNFSEYDDVIVYASENLLLNLGTDTAAVTSLDIEDIAIDDAPAAAEAVRRVLIRSFTSGDLPAMYSVTDITRRGALYFNWLDLLDTNVVVIFVLMLCVAAFTLISSLFIIILDRVPTIGVLRALGASRSTVSHIFLDMAMKLVGAGMIVGNVIGIGLMLLQYHTHLIPLDPEMYYLTYVPVETSVWAIVALNVGVAVASWLILILPARLAARIDPASTMRYE